MGYAQSIHWFEHMDTQRIKDRNLLFYVAHCHEENGNLDECIASYIEFLELVTDKECKNVKNAYANLGNVYFAKKEWAKAIECFKHLSDEELTKRNLTNEVAACYSAIHDAENGQKYENMTDSN